MFPFSTGKMEFLFSRLSPGGRGIPAWIPFSRAKGDFPSLSLGRRGISPLPLFPKREGGSSFFPPAWGKEKENSPFSPPVLGVKAFPARPRREKEFPLGSNRIGPNRFKTGPEAKVRQNQPVLGPIGLKPTQKPGSSRIKSNRPRSCPTTKTNENRFESIRTSAQKPRSCSIGQNSGLVLAFALFQKTRMV